MNPTIVPSADYLRILPELVLSSFGIIIMLADPLLPRHRSRQPLGIFALAGCLIALAATVLQSANPGNAFFGMFRVDGFSLFFHILLPAISGVCILASLDYMEEQQSRVGEYYVLILFATVGAMLMSAALELVLVFIALEISSISTYILAGFRRRSASSAESALKYFLLGSFATAFFLYGVALIFGATGTTRIPDIAIALQTSAVPASTPVPAIPPAALVSLATALMFVGLAFKVASSPFHIWTPDVYEGAPAPVVAFMSTGPKAAAFAVLLRIVFSSGTHGWFWLLWISAALSMTLGNFGALLQNNVKRMLAYSSIAHAGYLLVAITAGQRIGMAAAIFYTATYAAMNVGAFAVVSHFAGEGERFVTINDYAGLARRSPLLATTLTVFLLSLIGIPLTGGFFAKFYVFTAALQAHLPWLTIIGVVNSAIAAYYYLRLIVVMYMSEPAGFGLTSHTAHGDNHALAAAAASSTAPASSHAAASSTAPASSNAGASSKIAASSDVDHAADPFAPHPGVAHNVAVVHSADPFSVHAGVAHPAADTALSPALGFSGTRGVAFGDRPVAFSLAIALVIAAIATLYMGIVPAQVLDYATSAAAALAP